VVWEIMEDFTWVGWHSGGMTYDTYLNLTHWARTALHRSIAALIERANERGDGGGRPGDDRR
jgi:hypothetical protein